MANASKKHMGPATQGKGAGVGAMTVLPDGILEENMVLSNRDKSRHSDERGLDGKTVQTEQYHDHAGNRRNFTQQPTETALNTSGLSPTMTIESGADSSLLSQRQQPRD
jgi:hypothetical protein